MSKAEVHPDLTDWQLAVSQQQCCTLGESSNYVPVNRHSCCLAEHTSEVRSAHPGQIRNRLQREVTTQGQKSRSRKSLELT